MKHKKSCKNFSDDMNNLMFMNVIVFFIGFQINFTLNGFF